MISTIVNPGSARCRTPGAANSGFTIAELLAVMLIMVILMGMAVNSFYGMGRGSRMRSAVANFNTVLSLTRQFAITRTAAMDVELRQTSEGVFGYQVKNRNDNTLFRPLQFLPPSMAFTKVQEGTSPPKTDFSTPYVFTYRPDGSLLNLNGTLTIEISDEVGEVITFKVNGLTGLIQVSGD